MSKLSLAGLAKEIGREHRAIVEAVESILDHARRAGELLLEAASRCKHGEWLPWLSVNCKAVGERQARRYMQIAREWDVIEANRSSRTDLTIHEAIGLLADPAEESQSTALITLSPTLDPAAQQAEAEALVAEALESLPAEEQLQVIEQAEKKILERSASSKPPRDRRKIRLDRCNRWVKALRKDLAALGDEAEAALEVLDRLDQAIADLEEAG